MPAQRFRLLLFCVPLIAAAQSGLTGERELLSHPKALAGEPGRASVAELRKSFADPPAQYRSMPLWVWNDELEWPRLQEQLAQFKKQGMGGVFIHPRPGLMTEYLGRDWFSLWGRSIEEGKRLGLLVNIYDENSYPSGFAGGHVPALAPDTVSQYVQADFGANPRSIASQSATTVSFFAVRRNGAGVVDDARLVKQAADIPEGYTLVAFRLKRASGNPWNGGFPYVDLTNPRTTPLFLETTYERYKKEFGAEFGKTVRWAFTDEPLLATAGSYDSAALSLPLSYNTLAEFRKRNGYDLAPEIASLFWDAGDYRRVRFDYWQTLHDLWKENFMRPMFEWTDRNNLQFTGHWMEHEWPYPWITPADASLYAFQHVPGIDMLEGTNLRLKGQDPHLLFTIRQVASVAHQLGRRAFCEAYGVAGWDSTLEHYKRFGDWLMVHGINFMNQHLSFSTIRGARKRDHPQSFSDAAAWWPYYRLHADHLARVSMLSSRGESRNRVVILQQTTSGFLLARRGSAASELERMRASNAELSQYLADRQVDFDFGDEYMVEWFGHLDGRKFGIGRRSYDLVVLPPGMINLRKQTLPAMERYLQAGGEVLSLADPPAYVDGRKNGSAAELASRYPRQWRRVSSLDELAEEIGRRLPARIAFDRQMPMVGMLERWLDNGDRLLFLANSGLESRTGTATVEGGAVEAWDSVSGKMARVAAARGGSGRVTFAVDLPPAGSAVYVIAGRAEPEPARNPEPEWSPLAAPRWRVAADDLNVLPLDYADVRAAGADRNDINTWRANWNIWQMHGFERPAWDNAVQFRREIFDRNRFERGTGFEARFRFHAASSEVLRGLELAVESPELFRVEVNGQPLDFAGAKPWLDPHLRSVSVERLARAGENSIAVYADPFDVKMELENIYLRGRFRVEPVEKGFRLVPDKALDFGSWKQQGHGFYSGAVTYSAEVEVPRTASALRVELGAWSGSVAAVLLDGREVSAVGWPPFRAEFPAAPGRRTVAVRVVSTPRNTLGPFHHPDKLRMRAWPAAWAEFPEHQPPGRDYDLLDYGLMAPPSVSAGRMP